MMKELLFEIVKDKVLYIHKIFQLLFLYPTFIIFYISHKQYINGCIITMNYNHNKYNNNKNGYNYFNNSSKY